LSLLQPDVFSNRHVFCAGVCGKVSESAEYDLGVSWFRFGVSCHIRMKSHYAMLANTVEDGGKPHGNRNCSAKAEFADFVAFRLAACVASVDVIPGVTLDTAPLILGTGSTVCLPATTPATILGLKARRRRRSARYRLRDWQPCSEISGVKQVSGGVVYAVPDM
jgi:hypothetical protein